MLFPYQEGGPRAGPGRPGQEAAMERMEQIAFLNHILLEEMPQYREEAARFPRDAGSGYGELLTNQRQAEAAGRALESVRRAEEALSLGITPDALLLDVEEALSALGELTGQSVRDDVTDRIFQRFCVGK